LKETIKLDFSMNFAGRILTAEELEKSLKNVPAAIKESVYCAIPTVLKTCIAGALIATLTALAAGKIKACSADWLNTVEAQAIPGNLEMV
jgi:hypothetical protein